MAFLNNRMTAYTATDGFVYDYAIPRENGEHLYVKYLYLTRFDSITLTIDIFSKYKGEKEILDIVEDITNHIQTIRKDNPEVMYIAQKGLKILDDNKTGIVKKHGVLSYQFLLSSNPEEDENDDTEGD